MPSLGAPALLTGYTCGPFSCTGDTPEAQTALFQLQRLANAAAAVLGIPDRVTPDGKIGSKTVDLIQFIAVRLADDQTSTIREFWAATKAEIAEHAPALIADLTRITESGSPLTPNLPVVGTVGPRISIPIRTVPAVSAVSAAGQVFVPVVKTPYLAAGIAGGVALLLGGIAFALHQRSASSSMAGASGVSFFNADGTRKARRPVYRIDGHTSNVADEIKTKKEARKLLSDVVADSLERCRRSYRSCTATRTADVVVITTGGRAAAGKHAQVWDSFRINSRTY